MISDKTLLEEAVFIIKGETMIDTAAHFNISLKTLQKHMNVDLKDKADNDKTWKGIYSAVSISKNLNQQVGRKKGGENGVKPFPWKQEILELMANTIIDRDLTLRAASEIFGIPKSTLSSILNRIENKELLNYLKSHFEKNIINKNSLK